MSKDIRCPHCGYSRDADADDYGDDGYEFTEDCRNCDKSFSVILQISQSWETMCLDGEHKLIPNERHANWSDCETCGEFLKDK